MIPAVFSVAGIALVVGQQIPLQHSTSLQQFSVLMLAAAAAAAAADDQCAD